MRIFSTGSGLGSATDARNAAQVAKAATTTIGDTDQSAVVAESGGRCYQ